MSYQIVKQLQKKAVPVSQAVGFWASVTRAIAPRACPVAEHPGYVPTVFT